MAFQITNTTAKPASDKSSSGSGRAAPAVDSPPRLLLKPPDAAKSLEISVRKLAELTKRGLIPAVRIDRSVRYSVADLADFVAKARAVGAEP